MLHTIYMQLQTPSRRAYSSPLVLCSLVLGDLCEEVLDVEGGVLDDCHTPLAVALVERHGRLLVGLQASKTGLALRLAMMVTLPSLHCLSVPK